MTVQGEGYYTALLVKAEVREIGRLPINKRMASYSVIAREKRRSPRRTVGYRSDEAVGSPG